MLRRQARLRREYLYRKSEEGKHRSMLRRKNKIKSALTNNEHIPSKLRATALELQKSGEWDDAGGKMSATLDPEGALTNHEDDEYRWAGVDDPKIMITTSSDPSSRLKMFAKELRLIFPNAQRMNRGHYEMKQLVQACRANNVTDFIIAHETRGDPDGLIVCHLPYGPTAYFHINNVVMRHDIPDIGTMPEQHPHLVFHNFKSRLGRRVQNILKYLFPVPREDSHRVVTFVNYDDSILFRNHLYSKTGGGKHIDLKELGPRIQMRLYKIMLGTLEQGDAADTEWVFRPYMNTTRKRRFLSNHDPWNIKPQHDDDDDDEQ